jgi:hypothetical protein
MASKEEARRELARRELARRRGGDQPAAQPKQMGTILPISRDESGVKFDSDAGILGMLKSALTLPRDVMQGKVDPMSDEAIGRSFEMATIGSPVNPAVRAGQGVLPAVKPKMVKSKPKVPTADDLLKAGGADFDRMRASGVDYASDAVKTMAEALKRKLESDGFDPEVATKTHKILNKLASPPEGSVASIKGLHSARKTFRKVAQNFNDPTDQSAASQVISGLDDFIGSPGRGGVVAGSADEAAQALKSGNANYAAGKRSDLLTGIERDAGIRAQAANSGQNSGNAIRSRVASALLQPKRIAGYNAAEQAALEGIVKGSKAANATRYAGNLLGGGGGMGQMLTMAAGGATGAAVGGPGGASAGVMLPLAVGAGSKQLSNFLTKKALRSADEMVRMRSPLYERMLAEAPNVPISAERRAALIRALLASQQANQ